MTVGIPGPGGSLGQCCLCGKSFFVDIMMHRMIKTISIGGIEGELALHEKCVTELENLKGGGWESLPEGPLRSFYAEQVALGEKE